MFFSFDGIDGAGKSTQMQLFCDWLRAEALPPEVEIVTCRDPGSTPLGERVRELLLHREGVTIDRRAEMLLYMAARAQLVDELLRPALAAGKVIVCDRFLLANVAYQAYGGGLQVEAVRAVGETAIAGIRPDLTFLLDLDVATARLRLGDSADWMERQGTEYFERVRRGFLAEAEREPGRIVVIDARRPIEAMQAEIREAARRFLADQRSR